MLNTISPVIEFGIIEKTCTSTAKVVAAEFSHYCHKHYLVWYHSSQRC